MPEICRFLGIIIRMYWEDHAPPHIHVYYNEYEAQFAIETKEIIHGTVPKRVQTLVAEWMSENKNGLNRLWELAQEKQTLYKLPPLE